MDLKNMRLDSGVDLPAFKAITKNGNRRENVNNHREKNTTTSEGASEFHVCVTVLIKIFLFN